MQPFGKTLFLFGVVLAGTGLLLMFVGKLPGDISFKKDNIQFYFPLTTSILISVAVSLVLWILSHFKGK